MEPLARFAAIVAGEDAAVRLDEAALLIADAARPGADVDGGLALLDELAAQAGEPTLDGLNRLLFRDLGFAGNTDDYYDLSNSFLDDVLRRRVGIPITLAVVMLEVGRRMSVPLSGVSMPGHFLVRDKVNTEVFVDPFNRGQLLDRSGCAARFFALHGPGSVFEDDFLAPVGKRVILARMLANLESIAAMRSDRPLLLRVQRLRCALPEATEEDRRRLAASLGASAQFGEAAEVLESIGAHGDATRLRARLN
jgi:regulator of sirC expression with transglutaminase-like and TPR domain